MKSKQTRRALVMSLLSLLLCMSMLVGTTFAWFTDSVTSGRNQIVAGNLDIKLNYLGVDENDNPAWLSVDSDTKLFDDDALWEPGHTEVAYLQITNAGSLALKYQLAVKVYAEQEGTNVDEEPFALSDYLVFDVVDIDGSAAGGYTRDEARDMADPELRLEEYNSGTKVLAKNGDTAYVMLVIYMPEDVGNEANHLTGTAAPTISMGVELNATQYTYEEDSYGPDYDENAYLPIVYTADELRTALSANESVRLGADIDLGSDWTAIGTADEPYTGTLDGMFNTLTLSGDEGLFGYLDGATIQDVNLEVDLNGSAALAFTVDGTEDDPATIEGVNVSGTLVNAPAALISYARTGADAAQTSIKDAEIVLSNCVNNATVTNSGINRAVGLVATNYGASMLIEYCTNNGDLSVTNEDEAHAAGILGYSMRNTDIDNSSDYMVTIRNCGNNGDITAESTADGRANVGGIVSTAHQGRYLLENCSNSGIITGIDAAGKNQACVGGMIGRANIGSTLRLCSNFGDITASVTVTDGKGYAGSMVGMGDITGVLAAYVNEGAVTAATKVDGKIISDTKGVAAIGYCNPSKWTVSGIITDADDLLTTLLASQSGDVLYLDEGSYTLRFTNLHEAAIQDGLTLVGLGGVELSVTSTEASYGRIPANDITFENIAFVSCKNNAVGATGAATYIDCTTEGWLKNNYRTGTVTTIEGCDIAMLHSEESSGSIKVTDSEIEKAEYGGSDGVSFTDCVIGTLIPWNVNTTLENCTVANADFSHMTTATLIIDGVTVNP